MWSARAGIQKQVVSVWMSHVTHQDYVWVMSHMRMRVQKTALLVADVWDHSSHLNHTYIYIYIYIYIYVMCDMIRVRWFADVWHDSSHQSQLLMCDKTHQPLMCDLTRQLLMCDMTHQLLMCDMTHQPLMCDMTRQLLMCDMTHQLLMCDMTHQLLMCDMTQVDESCHTSEWVTSHSRMSRVTRVNHQSWCAWADFVSLE